jgi:hypothetical protein
LSGTAASRLSFFACFFADPIALSSVLEIADTLVFPSNKASIPLPVPTPCTLTVIPVASCNAPLPGSRKRFWQVVEPQTSISPARVAGGISDPNNTNAKTQNIDI